MQLTDKELIDALLKAREVLDKQKVPRPHYIQLPGMLDPEKFEDVLNKKLKLTYTLDV